MSLQEQIEKGKWLRQEISRKEQGTFKLHLSRDLVEDMIRASNEDRLPDLIPIRHWRMSASPFAFFRGTANIMAHDLYQLPCTDLKVQSVGDCHLMNFGGFATPERTLVFDINDFDETHPASWEWDLKRLAVSFVLAAKDNDMKDSAAEEIAFILAHSYHKNMKVYSEMNYLDLWYMKFDLETLRNNSKREVVKEIIDEAILAAQRKTQQQVFYKITQQVLGNFEITEQPPLVYHPFDVNKVKDEINAFWDLYLDTLQPNRRFLLSHYKIIDVALKVVGIGSVGTRCYVALLLNEKEEPLFIQIKEARSSILEPYTGKSAYEHHGQRVVEGQRLVQTASDIFLGWGTGPKGRHFYFRQLKDKKIAPEIGLFDVELLSAYARLCGRVLARAHAKTGNAQIISSYIGSNNQFSEAITTFAMAYAEQVNSDFEQFKKVIKSGKFPIKEE